MRKVSLFSALLLCVFGVCLFSATPGFAQLELPAKSPSASVTQRVGLTDITVAYSSPGVHGRKVWGELVPWDKVWRSGANKVTTISFSRPVSVQGHALAAGTYGFLTIPNKQKWTLILNSRTNVSGLDYDPKADVLRLDAEPEKISFKERLAFSVTDFDDVSAKVNLEWEKVRVSFPVTFDTDAQSDAAIQASLNNSWRPYADAARYNLENKKDLAVATTWIDQSVALKKDWLNAWIKAQILAAQGKEDEALPWAEKANQWGTDSNNFYGFKEVQAAIKKWSK